MMRESISSPVNKCNSLNKDSSTNKDDFQIEIDANEMCNRIGFQFVALLLSFPFLCLLSLNEIVASIFSFKHTHNERHLQLLN